MSFYLTTGNSIFGDRHGDEWARRYGTKKTAQEARRFAAREELSVHGRREFIAFLYESNRHMPNEPSVRSKLLVDKRFSYFDHFECYRRAGWLN